MMGLQAAIKTTKRKYEIEADCDADKKEASPPKTLKYSEPVKAKAKSADTDIIPPETHQWPNEPIVDSISKLQAVTETWNSGSLSTFNGASNTLSSLAQTAENITRSTLATTLLDQGDLMDSDEDDFQEDFDFDSDDDELLEDQTILTNQSYAPIRYPAPSPTRQNYIPAYPKPGYAPEPYQNCSRTPTAAAQYNGPPPPPPHLRPAFFNGTNGSNGSQGNWSYYNHQHYELAPTQQPQTIRCAENGKSYFELGSSSYCGPNRMCGGGLDMMKNCCEGRNNLWCTERMCYKEKRLKMMNLSMFKLARFRQASDQSLYRSVLICNTLKSLEKEIELENQIYHHQRLQHHHRQVQQNQASLEYGQSFTRGSPTPAGDTKQQQQQPQQQNNNLSNENSIINCNSNLSACNNSFSQPYNTNNCIINRIPSFNDPIPYEHHPLKDPSSGRATPFPTSPGISSLASPTQSSLSDADSAFGDVDDVDSGSTRSIDWGSVLSLSSQSALDPLSNNDIFANSTSAATSTTQNSTTITNLNITISNGNGGVTSGASTVPSSSPSSTPISSIITTLTTVSSCSLESLTASSISVSPNVSNSNWDFPYLETESSSNSEFYELNCYKLASAFNSMDEFVKSEPLVTPANVSPSSANELEQLTHIMVGS